MIKKLYSTNFILGALFFVIFINKGLAQTICPPDDENNLVTNGDFESGKTADFSLHPDFSYNASTVMPGGWSVGSNPSLFNSAFANIADHTGGSGQNMLVIDVPDLAVDKDVYSTDVTVSAGLTYYFSAWFANINKNTSCANCQGIYFENAPHLEFYINGVQIGSTLKVDSASHNWNQFSINWKSTVSGKIKIQIKNVKPGSGGNDLALDDISFKNSCAGIANLSSIGKASTLPDIIYACNEAFPLSLNSQLDASKYTFQWKTSSGAALSGSNTGSTYSFNTAPPAGKYYLCYDSTADGVLCPRTDSLIVKNELKVDISPNQELCDPINYNINSLITASGVTFNWERNGSPLGTNTASHQAISDGTYKLTVSKTGCPTASGSMTITKVVPTLNGTGTYCSTSNPKIATFKVSGASRINNAINIEWYKVATGGTKLTSTIQNDTTILVKAPDYVSIPGVCNYGIYAEDKNSFKTSVSQGTMGNLSVTNAPTYTMITVKGVPSLALNSIDFIQKNNNNGGLVTYTIKVYASQISSPCGKNNIPTPGALIPAATGSITVTQTTIATPRTINLNFSLPGSATGINYWIEISGGEIGYSGDSKPYGTSINNSPGANILSLGDTDDNGCFNGKKGVIQAISATAGKTNSCGRVFICATTEVCTQPVEFLNIEAKKGISGTIIYWATAWELNNKHFIVQKSLDGMIFSNLGLIEGNGSTTNINKYSFIDDSKSIETAYYRIIQVDHNGSSSESKTVAFKGDPENTLVIFPVPVKQGDAINFKLLDPSSKSLTIKDMTGKTLLMQEIKISNTIFSINANFHPGIYLVEIENEEGLKNIGRIIIE